MPKGGGTPSTFATGAATFVLNGGYVYYVTVSGLSSLVVQAPVTGTGGPAVTLLSMGTNNGSGFIGPMAFSSTDVYAVGTVPSTLGAQLLRAPLAGGAQSFAATMSSMGLWKGVATDSNYVYLAKDDPPTSSIERLSFKGGSPSTIATPSQADMGDLIVDGTTLYWANLSGTGAITKMDVGGGTQVTLMAETTLSVSNMVVGATSVYWTGGDCSSGTCHGVLMSLPK
jgi:hypothetical protein